VTVILTSHYMADVVALCPRVILIHQGELLYDGALDALAQRLAPFKLLRLTLESGQAGASSPVLPPNAEVIQQEDGQMTLRVPQDEAAAVTARLLNTLPVRDLAVENPAIEDVIDQVYERRAV
jgi:ABC-2 type transport system ATP-binding protein